MMQRSGEHQCPDYSGGPRFSERHGRQQPKKRANATREVRAEKEMRNEKREKRNEKREKRKERGRQILHS
jgi:hypothetical protein